MSAPAAPGVTVSDGTVRSPAIAGFEPLGTVQQVTVGPPGGIKCVYLRAPDGFVRELIEAPPQGVALEDFQLAARRRGL